MEFKATIEAKKLKHAISVLRRIKVEAIFNITLDGLTCRLVDAANSQINEIVMSGDAFDYHRIDEPHKVGVNLNKVASIITRATTKDTIVISADSTESWQFERGIHHHALSLRPIEELRKAPETPELSHAATVTMSGKEFKEIVAEAGAAGEALRVTVRSSEGVIFDAEQLMDDVPYRGKLDAGRLKIRADVFDVQAVYSIDYLQDIAIDMQVADEIILKFATDMPCEIAYARDGVKVRHILAPRIESD
jgi:DNA polymerase III sliding clamp (beta) subunit (PCNA family)